MLLTKEWHDIYMLHQPCLGPNQAPKVSSNMQGIAYSSPFISCKCDHWKMIRTFNGYKPS